MRKYYGKYKPGQRFDNLVVVDSYNFDMIEKVMKLSEDELYSCPDWEQLEDDGMTIEKWAKKYHRSAWAYNWYICKCDCGDYIYVREDKLTKGLAHRCNACKQKLSYATSMEEAEIRLQMGWDDIRAHSKSRIENQYILQHTNWKEYPYGYGPKDSPIIFLFNRFASKPDAMERDRKGYMNYTKNRIGWEESHDIRWEDNPYISDQYPVDWIARFNAGEIYEYVDHSRDLGYPRWQPNDIPPANYDPDEIYDLLYDDEYTDY